MAQFGLRPIQKDPLEYAGQKLAVVPTFDSPRAPTILDRKQPIQSVWRDSTTNNEWILVDVIAGDAQWRLFTGGVAGAFTSIQADDGNIAFPNVGIIDIDGNVVASGTHATPLFTIASVANTIDLDIQVASAQGASAINNSGICSFNNGQFTVDANGFVSLAGAGLAVDQIGVDSNTGPGVDPVDPDATGLITVAGAAVANHSVPLETHSRALNTYNIEIQVANDRTGAPGNTADAGIVSFDDTMFVVDADGYVQLIGGGLPLATISGDDAVAITPDGVGNFNFTGEVVVNATHAKPLYFVDSGVANTEALQIQVGAAITGAPGDTNDAGIVSFDDTMFTVDADGYVQLIGGGLAVDQIGVDSNTGPGVDPVNPDATGLISVAGAAVANHSVPLETHSRALNAYNIEVQVANDRTGAPGNTADTGVCSFNDTHFLVDADGYVSLIGGGAAVDQIAVDSNTGPGVDPVNPDAAGLITVAGAAVANHGVPIETHSRALNTYNIEVQVANDRTGAPGNTADAGVCSFNDTHFLVDADGYVSLVGAGLAIDSFTTDVAGPISPDGAGNVDITGTSVFSDGTVANTLALNVQATANTFLVGAGAGTTATELGPLTNGQLIIGSTGVAPATSTLTAGVGVSITNGAGAITISSNSVVNEVGVSNIGFSYSSPTFTITSADGSALSASNPGYVTIYSKTSPGQTVTVAVTANQTFVDDSGGSTIIGNLFGFLAADTTASDDVPFFIYGVMNDAENAISFMISRHQARRESPAVADIGKTGSAVADNSWSFFALSNPTVADYDTNPCLCIGCFRTRLTTAGGDWTVQALDNEDGIGQFFEQKRFELPVAILGASANTHWQDNGGNAPIILNPTLSYRLLRNGDIQVNYQAGNCDTSGVGAVRARCIVPFPGANTSPGSDQADAILCGEINEQAGTKIILIGSVETGDYMQYVYIDNGNSGILTNVLIIDVDGEYQMGGNYTPRFS